MPKRQFTVRCEWDAEAEVWYVADSNVPGLSTEAATPKELVQKLLVMIPELVEANDLPDGDEEVPLELLYTQSASVRVGSHRH
jgi:predicted RNase H-like HicB family nuclease